VDVQNIEMLDIQYLPYSTGEAGSEWHAKRNPGYRTVPRNRRYASNPIDTLVILLNTIV
jgi:hypothetical protein